MPDVLTFTPQPLLRTTPGASGTFQPGHTAIEVLQYDILDIDISIVGMESPGVSPLVTISIVSSLQNETTDATFGAGAFTATFNTANPASQSLNLPGTFLRYARWFIWGGANWGTQASVTFFIRGMGRKRNEL